jgi:hypothetical protein
LRENFLLSSRQDAKAPRLLRQIVCYRYIKSKTKKVEWILSYVFLLDPDGMDKEDYIGQARFTGFVGSFSPAARETGLRPLEV